MRRLMVVAIALMFAVSSTGCILSRLTDRAFVGFHVKRPTYTDRKVTGLFLLPFTFAIDLVTLPIQVILLAIAGDDFVMGSDDPDPAQVMLSLKDNPTFQRLSDAQQLTAATELSALMASGQVTRGTSLALTDEGHWLVVELSAEARAQVIARAARPDAAPQEYACAP